MSALRSTGRCRHVLPRLLIFNGLRVGWYASRTLTSCLPSALPLHLHASHAQAMPRSSSSSNELPETEREISTTSRALVEIMGYSTRSSAALTHKGALLFRAREHAPARPDMRRTCVHHPYITCCTRNIHTRAHTRALLPARSRFCARLIASCFRRTPQVTTPRVLGRRPSSWRLQLLAARAAHAAAFPFSFFPDRARCSPVLSRRVSEGKP